MRKIADTLQMIGIIMTTGVGAIIGFVGGALAFDPYCKITVSRNKEESE